MKWEADSSLQAVFATLSVVHHFGDGISAFGALPVGFVSVNPADNAPSERASGFSDIIVGARYDFTALTGRELLVPGVAFRLGLGLPSGAATKVNGDFGPTISTEIVAVGTGAFVLYPALDVWLPLTSSVALTMPISARIPMNRGPTGILFGASVSAGLGVSAALTDWLRMNAQVKARVLTQANEESKGALVNSGGTAIAAQLAFSASVSKRVSISLAARVPFYTYAGGQQVSETFSTTAGVSISFGGKSDDDDDHGDEKDGADKDPHSSGNDGPTPVASGKKGDSLHLAKGGDTFNVATSWVAGKVTVIDFWAEWCKSCKALGKELDALAATEDKLAIRKVEVPTMDTAVAKQHLPGITAMPNVWIYDRYGTLIHKLSGISPEEAMTLVKAALKRQKVAQAKENAGGDHKSHK